MEIKDFRVLLSPAGQEALQTAQAMQPLEKNFLRDYAALSRQYPGELARSALETAILRGEAAVKFPFAAQMYFTRPALEQASAYEVSAYRMQRYSHSPRLPTWHCSLTQAGAPMAGGFFPSMITSLRWSWYRPGCRATRPWV
jgi:hypothetical protein